MKKRDWASQGFIAPIIIPATPNLELAKELQKVADEESDSKIRLKDVDRGGRSMIKTQQHCAESLCAAAAVTSCPDIIARNKAQVIS